MGKLVRKYDDRIKNFIYEMVNTPIEIKDYSNKVISTRKELLEEENSKIIGKKGFQFKSFQTEKERVQEYLQQKDTIYNKSNIRQLQLYSPGDTKKEPKHIEYDSPNNSIMQPSMRFKARTDLERIFETINNYSYGRADKELVQKQLRNLELNVSKKNETEEEHHSDDEYIPSYTMASLKPHMMTESERFRDMHDKILNERRNGLNKNKNIKRKLITNVEAKNLMSEYHKKTHFKAATGFTLFDNQTTVNPFYQSHYVNGGKKFLHKGNLWN